ncbi:RAB3C member RAS oncogene family [Fasciola gigantica]|uniref:RAB3C member RAS oncogene family n=1 Tax=Fasciola gigantica TaxID=46835 RepID=A0A504YUS5_FASGI|nr:RAB3C member RAS oncogene family [Fasciola gigantica]
MQMTVSHLLLFPLLALILRSKPSSAKTSGSNFKSGVTQIKTYSWDNAQVVLVGNKCDLANDRAVSVDWGRRLAQQLGLEFFEASAKDDINVKQVFERLVDLICEKMSDNLENNPSIAGAPKKGAQLTDRPEPQHGNCQC